MPGATNGILKQNGNSNYQMASQRDDLEIYEKNPDKTERTCCQKCALSSCLLGMVFILGGVISTLIMKPFVHHQIIDNLVLTEGGKAFNGWKDPPVTPIMKMYFFNLTNMDDFLRGRAKPRVQKIGPYVYYEEMHKTNISFQQSGDFVTFSDNKTYFFSSALSQGDESDLIIMPNLPLLGTIRTLGGGSTTFSLFENMISSQPFGIDKRPFIHLTVKEFLWAYPSLVMSVAAMQACTSEKIAKEDAGGFGDDWDDWDDEEEEESNSSVDDELDCSLREDSLTSFGLFLGRNQTVLNPRTVNTGKADISLKGIYLDIEGSSRLGFWQGQNGTCNQITGQDPGTLSIDIKKDEMLDLYFNSMCRKMSFRYIKTVEYEGMEAYRFSPVEETFNTGQETPENSCYCNSRPCPPSGIFDLGAGCKASSPVLMSWPHFLYGDPVLRDRVDGIDPPNREEHTFQMDIQPTWGTTLAVSARFQMNVLIENNGYRYFRNIKEKTYLPFLIIDEGISGPNEIVVSKMKMLLGLEDTVMSLTAVSGVVLGFCLMLPEIVLWIRSCCSSQKVEYVNKI